MLLNAAGVSPSRLIISKEWQGHVFNPKCSLIDYLCHRFVHIPAHIWHARLQSGKVINELGQPYHLDSPAPFGQTVLYYREVAAETVVPFTHNVLFEDEHLLVVDKPHFLTVAPAGQYVEQTLLSRLKLQTGNALISPIHRLDRETAGVMLFSKQASTRSAYQQLFKTERISKTYHAVVTVTVPLALPTTVNVHLKRGQPFYTMQIAPDLAANSVSYVSLIRPCSLNTALVKINPTTGKMHQIRVHLASIGLPIVNDTLYPIVGPNRHDHFENPLQLLAHSIEFIDPLTQVKRHFQTKFVLADAS